MTNWQGECHDKNRVRVRVRVRTRKGRRRRMMERWRGSKMTKKSSG